jgi:hypothetical protein
MMLAKTLTHRNTLKTNRDNNFRLLLLLVYMIFFWLAFFLPSHSFPIFFTTFILTSIALWFGPLAVWGSYGKRKIYDPATVFNLATLYYAIKGIPVAWGEQTGPIAFLPYIYLQEIYPIVVIFTTLGLISFNWFYSLTVRKRDDGIAKQVRLEQVLYPNKGVFFLTLIGLVSFYVLLQSIGSDNVLFFLLNPHSRAYIADSQRGLGAGFGFFWLYGINSLIVASLIWLIGYGSQRRKPGVGWWLHALMTVWVLFLVSPRANVLSYIISTTFIYHLTIAPVKFLTLSGFGFIGVIYAYLINLWRGIMGRTGQLSLQEGFDELSSRFNFTELATYIGGTDLADIRVFVLITHAYGNYLPLKYGETFLRLITQFIPRTLWPNKPYDLGTEIVGLYIQGSLSGMPPSFLGEMYMNFGYLGVIIGSGILGILLAKLYINWMLNKTTLMGLLFYAILLPRIFIGVSSTFANVVLTVVIMMIIAYSGLVLCRFEYSGDSGLARGYGAKV